MSHSIGIIGGTGRQGSALAKRCISNGYEVRIGSRSEERGKNSAKEISEELGISQISGGTNAYACDAEIVVLAIPFDQVETLLEPISDKLANKIILDMTVNLSFGKYITTNLHNGKSSYEFIREYLPDSKVVACLKTISFVVLDDLSPIDQTDFQMSISEEAYEFSSSLVKKFGLSPVRVKGKMHAHTIERMVALSIQLNKEYSGSHVGYQLTDINLQIR